MKRFIPATIFGIAFGFLEAIVVVYLRKIYYPDGFSFPLVLIEPQILKIEIIREVSTIIMLSTIGWILGKKFGERFSFFIFTFAVWDIFYYVALKLFLDWPESLLTWDILFLIPITWVGPVLAPVICSLGMILIALTYIYLTENTKLVKFSTFQVIFISAGVITIIYTFIYDYFTLITKNNLWKYFNSLMEREEFLDLVTNYVPKNFNWVLFSAGCLLIGLNYLISFINAAKRK